MRNEHRVKVQQCQSALQFRRLLNVFTQGIEGAMEAQKAQQLFSMSLRESAVAISTQVTGSQVASGQVRNASSGFDPSHHCHKPMSSSTHLPTYLYFNLLHSVLPSYLPIYLPTYFSAVTFPDLAKHSLQVISQGSHRLPNWMFFRHCVNGP